MKAKFFVCLFCACILIITGCTPSAPSTTAETATSVGVQGSTTPADSVPRERAVRLVRSAVVAEIQIVDPFSVEIKEMQGSGEALIVNYLSPLNSDDPEFDEELVRVVFKAVTQYVRAEPAIPHLVVIATSVSDIPGSKGFVINYEDSLKWVKGKIDDQAFKKSWTAAE